MRAGSAFYETPAAAREAISRAMDETARFEIDGKTYPLFKLDTSSESHPFYTGAQTRIVEAGRVEKFRQKFAAKTEAVNAAAAEATKAKADARRR